MNIEPIEFFNEVEAPDLGAASALMRANWTPPCWLYEPDLLAMHILRPTGDPTMASGLRAKNGDLAAYLAFIPLRVRVFDTVYSAVFASFFTVSHRYRRHHLSDRQQGLMVDRARNRGYDLYLAVTVAGTPVNQTVARSFGTRGLRMRPIHNFRYLAGVAPIVRGRLSTAVLPGVRRYRQDDEARAFELLSEAGTEVDLAKVVAREDVDFTLRTRPRIQTYVYETGGAVQGLLSVAVLPVVAGRVGLNAYVESVAFGRLDTVTRAAFVDTVLRTVLAQGVEAVMIPDTGYADMSPFRRLGFRAAPRKLRLLLAPLRSEVLTLPEEVGGFYLDVF